MVASNARDVLRKENEMLDKLVQTASDYAQDAPGLEKEVFDAWVAALSGHRDINADLISKSDGDFDAALKNEAALLQNSLNPISGPGQVAQYWKAQLDKDIKIANKLV